MAISDGGAVLEQLAIGTVQQFQSNGHVLFQVSTWHRAFY